jgi:hypothetical protein
MQVRWANVIAFGLFVIALVLIFCNWRAIAAFLGTMKSIGPGHSPEEMTLGLVAFGLTGILVLAAIRILHNNDFPTNK